MYNTRMSFVSLQNDAMSSIARIGTSYAFSFSNLDTKNKKHEKRR